MVGKGGPNNSLALKGLVPLSPKLYLEPEVLDALRAIAARDDRSINRTIARMIREALQREQFLPTGPLATVTAEQLTTFAHDLADSEVPL